jgi:putative iron-dependent peroxidase
MTVPEEVRVVPQPVCAPLSRAAIFLTLAIKPGSDQSATLRSFCGDLSGLLRAVEYRDLQGGLSCVMGIGSDAWILCLGCRGQRNYIPSARFAPGPDTRSLRRAT